MTRILISIAALGFLSACASIVEGTTQDITVNTTPPGAECDVLRQTKPIAHIASTPASVSIDKTKDDILVVCKKPGYHDASAPNHSDAAGFTAGNVLLPIGWAIDSARGADNKYESVMNLTLAPGSSATNAGSNATTVPYNMALITIYHPKGEVSGAWAGGADVDVNGNTACRLSNGSYFNSTTAPGNVTISSTKFANPGTSKLNVTTQANQHYYVRITWNTGRNWTQATTGIIGAAIANITHDEKGPFIIEKVDEDVAKNEMQGLSAPCN